jgi:hypothetical protein
MILGRVDKVGNHRVFGWAADDRDFSECLSIEIVQDGSVVARGSADRFRADLKSGGFGEGDHAFEIDLPPDQPLTGFEVRAIGTHSNATLEFADAEEHKFSELYDILVARYDTLFAAMAQRSQAFEREFRGSLNQQIEERTGRISETLQDFNARLDTAEVSLLRIDEMVRRLVENNAKKRRKRFFGLF